MTVLLPSKLKGKHQFCQGLIPILSGDVSPELDIGCSVLAYMQLEHVNLRVQAVKESSSTGIFMHQGTNLNAFGNVKELIVCVHLLSDLYYLSR